MTQAMQFEEMHTAVVENPTGIVGEDEACIPRPKRLGHHVDYLNLTRVFGKCSHLLAVTRRRHLSQVYQRPTSCGVNAKSSRYVAERRVGARATPFSELNI